MVRKRSVVWGFFKEVDAKSVQCLVCTGHLMRLEQGTTTNMLRHLRVKHPTVFKKIKGRVRETPSINGHPDTETEGLQLCSGMGSLLCHLINQTSHHYYLYLHLCVFKSWLYLWKPRWPSSAQCWWRKATLNCLPWASN